MPNILRFSLPLAVSSLATATYAETAPRVVTDIAPIHSLVAQVMDGVGTPDLLIPADASPHGYALRPSEARALADADFVVSIGEALLPWIEERAEGLAPNATYVSLLDVPNTHLLEGRDLAVFLEASVGEDDHDHGDHEEHGHKDHAHDDHGHEEHAHDDHGHKDHAHGDDHAHAEDDHGHKDHDHDHAHAHEDDHAEKDHEDHAHGGHGHDDHGHAHGAGHVDPHAWLDPENAALWLAYIADTLSAADPAHADIYQANAAAGQEKLTALDAELRAKLGPVADVPFLVYHDAYQYFETEYDLSVAGAIAAGDAAQPGPARLAELRDLVQAEGISCIFAEPQYPQRLAVTLSEGASLTTATLDPIGADLDAGPDLYATVLRNLVDDAVGCLSASLSQ